MQKDFPNIFVAGTYSPPFKSEYTDLELAEMIQVVNEVSPDLLWVGMTAPKQEKWIYHNQDRLRVKCVGAVGAVFDFYTGQVHRSSPFFQRVGLEWLPRLIQQPKRLWKRMFISAPIFVYNVILARIGWNK
jgi:N-acetylglucosaminyldiphosphoundecaprenol N-acetyl-beta-D-mannosaminyltransferase